MGLGSERQVKIDYVGKALEVLNLKGLKRLVPFTS